MIIIGYGFIIALVNSLFLTKYGKNYVIEWDNNPMYTSTESVHQERGFSKETQQFCQGYFRRV